MVKGKRKPSDALAGTGLKPLFVPREEARRLLDIGKRRMKRLLRQGILESFMLDGGWRVTYASVVAFMGDAAALGPKPPFVTVAVASALTRVSKSKLYELMREGRVKWFPFEGGRRIPYDSLEALNPNRKGEPLIAPESNIEAPPAQAELFLPKRRGRPRKAAMTEQRQSAFLSSRSATRQQVTRWQPWQPRKFDLTNCTVTFAPYSEKNRFLFALIANWMRPLTTSQASDDSHLRL